MVNVKNYVGYEYEWSFDQGKISKLVVSGT